MVKILAKTKLKSLKDLIRIFCSRWHPNRNDVGELLPAACPAPRDLDYLAAFLATGSFEGLHKPEN